MARTRDGCPATWSTRKGDVKTCNLYHGHRPICVAADGSKSTNTTMSPRGARWFNALGMGLLVATLAAISVGILLYYSVIIGAVSLAGSIGIVGGFCVRDWREICRNADRVHEMLRGPSRLRGGHRECAAPWRRGNTSVQGVCFQEVSHRGPCISREGWHCNYVPPIKRKVAGASLAALGTAFFGSVLLALWGVWPGVGAVAFIAALFGGLWAVYIVPVLQDSKQVMAYRDIVPA